jgi:sn-glycerol 3-phosphate transport system ATP-binding protein
MNLIPRDGRLLGIRPEHLEPCAESVAAIVAEVDLIEPLGADTLVYGRVAGSDGARVAARLPASSQVQAGKLGLRYDPTNAHWFDPASGRRIEA